MHSFDIEVILRIIDGSIELLLFLYVRRGFAHVRSFFGHLPRRRRKASGDDLLDQLRLEADGKLGEYLDAQKRLTTYTERPREARHR